VFFKYCDLASDCTRSYNWISEVLVDDLTNPIKAPQIAVSSNYAYISYYAGGYLRLAICNLSTGCDLNGEWSYKLNLSSSATKPSMVLANNRVAIAAVDTSGQPRFYYCYTSSDCTNLGNWTLDVLVSTDASNTEISLGASLNAFYIIKPYDKYVKKYYCSYSNGCESTSDWISMNLYTASAPSDIKTTRNMAAQDISSANQYATLLINNILKVGICPANSSYYCNLSNWEFVDLQSISSYYGSDYQADISVYDKNLYVTYMSSNEIKMARCNMNKTNCFNRDNWKISSVYKGPNLKASASNLVNLFVDSSGNIFQAYVEYQRLYILFQGKMEPEW
jgi:hypothetical protein